MKNYLYSFVPRSGLTGLWLLAASDSFAAQPITQSPVATLPNLNLSKAGTVYAMAVEGDGKIIIGGSFRSVNGVPVTNLARITTQGAVDADWTPNPNDIVSALAVSGSNVFVGGYFSGIGGLNQTALARVSTTGNGAADPAWTPQFEDGAIVMALELSDSNLFIGGDFSLAGGEVQSNAADFTATGSPATALPWNPNPNSTVNCIIASGNNVYLGGYFTQVRGITRNRLAMVSSSGSGAVDCCWDPEVDEGSPIGSSFVTSMALGASNLYAGGTFTNVGGYARTDLAKVVATGSGATDSSWNPNPVSASGNFALALNGTTLFVGGGFTEIGGQYVTNLASLSTLGSGEASSNWFASFNSATINVLLTNESWLFVGGNFSLVNDTVSLGITKLDQQTAVMDDSFVGEVEIPGIVYALAEQLDGKIIIAGDFWLSEQTECPHLARINTDGSLDTQWTPATDGVVTALALSGTNLFVGGPFANISGQSRNGLAEVDTSGTDLVNATWNPPISSTAAISALAADSNNNLYVGGANLGISGISNVSLAVFSTGGSGLAATNWTQVANGPVYALALSGGDLFAGGQFISIGGQARSNIVRYVDNGSGFVDTNWNVAADHAVYSLAVSGTNLFMGGAFQTVGGLSRQSLAKVTTASPGAVDPLWNAGALFPPKLSRVYALGVAGSNLYVGGSFTSSISANLLSAGISEPGTVSTSWTPAPNGTVQAIQTSGQNVYVGGSFRQVGGTYQSLRNGFAYLAMIDAPIMTETSSDTFEILPSPADGPAVTAFQITAINATSIFLSDGVTPVLPGNFITLAEGSAGLIFTGTNGSVTAYAALNETTNGIGSASATLNLGAVQQPAFSFLGSTLTVDEDAGEIVISVEKDGAASGSIGYFTTNGSAVGVLPESTVVVPNFASNSLGGANNGYPFDIGPTNMHYQQVYAASQFGAMPPNGGYITGIQFRPFVNFGPFSNTLGAVTISLTTTSNGPDGLSTNFASNVGPDETIVFNGPLSLSSADIGNPPAFDIVIPLTTPFFYQPTNGNLLMDVVNTDGGDTLPFDSTFATGDPVSRVLGPADSPTGDTDTAGLVTQFTYSDSPPITNGVDYTAASGTLNFGPGDTNMNIVIDIDNNTEFDGDKTFNLDLYNPTNGAIEAVTTVTIANTDPLVPVGSVMTNVAPSPLPPATGSFTVTFPPGLSGAEWRLAGQTTWQSGGATISNLVTGNYYVEFMPLTGYLQPDHMLVSVSSGAFSVAPALYQPNLFETSPGTGYLTEILYPGTLASNADVNQRAQWRPVGYATWLDSGDEITNLAAGLIFPIEFKPVSGWLAPQNDILTILPYEGVESLAANSTYYSSTDGNGEYPQTVSFGVATQQQPYAYTGQLQTDLGTGSATVVSSGVVLTASHLLFNSQSLSYVNDASWYFQRYNGNYEPVPQIPRGFHLLSGYAAQVQADNSPGTESLQAQSMDAAAVYFLEPAGRGGYGGYVMSDDNSNWLTSSRLKMIVGYPSGSVSGNSQGQLMATPTNTSALTQLQSYSNLFGTTAISGYTGMDGGALEVLADDGNYYPAGIYLGPSQVTNMLTVRAIDANVSELLNVAELSATSYLSVPDPSGPHTLGGGIIVGATNSPIVMNASPTIALLQIQTGPIAALQAKGGWHLTAGQNMALQTDLKDTVVVGGGATANVEFQCIQDGSYALPYQAHQITITSGATALVLLPYLAPSPSPNLLITTASKNVVLSLSQPNLNYTNYTFDLEYTTSLLNPTWISLGQQTLVPPANSVTITDPLTTGDRYYRAKWITCPSL